MITEVEAAEMGYRAWKNGDTCPFTSYDESLQEAWARGWVAAADDFLACQLDQFQKASLELMPPMGTA